MAQIRPIDVRPLSNPMDNRSMPDEPEFSTWRLVQNLRVDAKNETCRVTGFQKLLARANYNNQDLHDQLQSLTGLPSRLPVTFLFESQSTRRGTKLLAGTKEAIYALNNTTGNWKVIWDQMDSENRPRADRLGDTVLFSNNEDGIKYWNFDQGITETASQSVADVPDLVAIGITKAAVIIVWKDVAFLMNVVLNGSVKSNQIFWSNYQKALEWFPDTGSLAGSRELDINETIIGALPLSNKLLIYTNRSIWEATIASDVNVGFSFVKRYDPEEGKGCLFYPNILINTGDRHVFGGKDGIYVYSLFEEKPLRVDWMHAASAVMYKRFDAGNCNVHIAGYNTDRNEILISYAEVGFSQPNKTLVLNAEFPFAYILDHGFSAFTTYTIKEPVEILQNFILRYGMCSPEEFELYFGLALKEGGIPACANPEVIVPTIDPQSIWTQQAQTISYAGETVQTEDWNRATADANSLCVLMAGLTINQQCERELRSDDCNADKRFVGASSTDFCLKEFVDVYFREMCVNFSGCGGYQRQGYKSLFRSGPLTGGIYENDKVFDRFEIEIKSSFQTIPSTVRLMTGVHSQAIDPNDDQCGIVWIQNDLKRLECLSKPAAQSKTEASRPSRTYEWPLYHEGRFIYFEVWIENPDVNPPDTGGPCCFSRYTVNMAPLMRVM